MHKCQTELEANDTKEQQVSRIPSRELVMVEADLAPGCVSMIQIAVSYPVTAAKESLQNQLCSGIWGTASAYGF